MSIRTIPIGVVQLMAEIDTAVDYHTEDGAGLVFCNGCEARMEMKWYEGKRLDKPEDLTHKQDCPVIWARHVLGLHL
ncbi:hypothetical protein UFOVP435_64 [uncultured Caudovirales phage]|uniref:Uncharacterized protein n=1 Tax=uncultured Caudovirales phage TaxID=2100421 RepID=A0A6J5MAG4_9CAUD|nr:hypothetical protein UFOVP435_64 [uncultured Caudovirales phage]